MFTDNDNIKSYNDIYTNLKKEFNIIKKNKLCLKLVMQ